MNIGDEERTRRAKEERGRMRGPWETSHCEHGRLYSYRWTWQIGGSVDGGDIEIGRNGCSKCREED